jgi:3-deoxy-7-phosphoheptulonate synthase
MRTIDGLRIRDTQLLLCPAALAAELPLADASADFIARSRRAAEEIILGQDDRLLVVVGPCSIHDPEAALDYAERLRDAVGRHASELCVIMRVFVEKPRTIIGWKGLIDDPGLDDSYRIGQGLRLARRLLLNIAKLRLPAATEFLDPILGQYHAELVTWGAIGARTVESQVHRALASGLSMPIGFKNRTDGDVQVAVDALLSARHPHWFASVTRDGAPAMLGTTGNSRGLLVLRGGKQGPNYNFVHVQTAVELLCAAGLPPRLMVDCSHGNSGRDPARQPAVAAAVAAQIAAGQHAICGVMLEGNLLDGTQNYRVRPLVYGRSVTDSCLAWEKTIPVLGQLAAAVRARRSQTRHVSRPALKPSNAASTRTSRRALAPAA